nr:hypothetical protein [Tanacetum cinerariifolium]
YLLGLQLSAEDQKSLSEKRKEEEHLLLLLRSLSIQIRASPSNEKGNSNNLTVVLGTSGCLNVDVTLLKKQRWLCGSCLPPSIGACNIWAIVRLSAIVASVRISDSTMLVFFLRMTRNCISRRKIGTPGACNIWAIVRLSAIVASVRISDSTMLVFFLRERRGIVLAAGK